MVLGVSTKMEISQSKSLTDIVTKVAIAVIPVIMFSSSLYFGKNKASLEQINPNETIIMTLNDQSEVKRHDYKNQRKVGRYSFPESLRCDTNDDGEADTEFKFHKANPNNLGGIAVYEYNGRYCAGYFFRDDEMKGNQTFGKVIARPLIKKDDQQPSGFYYIDVYEYKYGFDDPRRDQRFIFDPKPLAGDLPIRSMDVYTLDAMFTVSTDIKTSQQTFK